MTNYTRSNYSPYAVINWIADSPLKSGQKSVLLALTRYISKKNGYRVWPSQKLLCEKAGMGETALRSNLIKLLDLGYIETDFVPCKKGPGRYEYTLNVPSECEGTQPRNVGVEPSETEHKGDVLKGLDIDKKVEVPTGRAAPSASSWEQSLKSEKTIRREKLDQLRRDYGKSWANSRPARLSVYCQLGRLYFPENPYFEQKKFKPHHFSVLDDFFSVLGKYSVDVLAWTFEQWAAEKDGTTPTLMNLEKHSPFYLYEGWNSAHQHKAQAATYQIVADNLEKEQAA